MLSDTLVSVALWLLSILGLILLVVSYTYINKLEQIDCKCAEHPYRRFIKGFIIFAIVFLLLLMVFPANKMARQFGNTGSMLYSVATLLFTVAAIVFFVYALIYVRYLMRVKCMCSEDGRRTALYVWSIVELVLLGLLVIIPLLAILILTTIGLITSGVKQVSAMSPTVVEAVSNPVKSARRIPSTLRRELKALSKA
jgi:hypothetical protein